MSVRKKINIGFMTVEFLALLSLGFAAFQFFSLDRKVEKAIDSQIVQMQITQLIEAVLANQGMYASIYVTEPSKDNLESLSSYSNQLTANIEELSLMALSNDMQEYVGKLSDYNETIQGYVSGITRSAAASEGEIAQRQLKNEYMEMKETMSSLAGEMADYLQKDIAHLSDEVNDATLLSTIVSGISFIFIVIIVTAYLIFVRRSVTKPLSQVVEQASIIAGGDLSRPDYTYKNNDEIGSLVIEFNKMKHSFQKIIFDLQKNSAHVSESANTLFSATASITASTGEAAENIAETSQAAGSMSQSTKEIAQAMDETASGIQRIAEATQLLHQNALDMNETADFGIETIVTAQQQMNTINESTRTISHLTRKLSEQTDEIGEITKVITAITEQTNLLALNAAIEAARAGEHGKGFAVVADEVRKLAEQSKLSAEQIVSLIGNIHHDMENVEQAVSSGLVSVSEGVEVIQKAGTAFEEITANVASLTTQVEEVSATSQQISASAEEVSASINEVARATEQTSVNLQVISSTTEKQSATIQNVHTVSTELSQNAQELDKITKQFKLP